jgi:predicted anti-sigma-YlaC factor YlaD
MNCNQVEDLLSRYIEGDLCGEESLIVEEHIAGCARCRESYAAYKLLEESLVGLKGELPSPAAISGKIMQRLGLMKKRRRAGIICSFPFVASLAVLVCSVILFVYHESLEQLLARIGKTYIGAAEFFSENMPRWIIQVAGGETWVLLSVYVLLTLLIILIGGLTVTRFIQE